MNANGKPEPVPVLDPAIAAAPVLVAELVGAGVAEAGDFIRFTVKSKTQGFVAIQFTFDELTVLIDTLLAQRNAATKLIARKTGQRKVPITPAMTFAVGDFPGIPGVVVTLNHNQPNEQLFALPEARFAADLGRALIKQAGIAKRKELMTPKARTLILPGKH